ncbi:MAG: excinuclease ABC subunit UvrB [Candidatus Nealsonbacteria bacterium]|nr:excinuclease ABC subunit UvrB [Candidatus Nealsonbacteria bacterium]
MSIFKLKAKYKPAGDQPKAIEKLIKGLEKKEKYQTLLGVTGSGKTFTMASVIEHFDMPVLVIAPNKTLAAQLYREYKNFFPENSVNYFVSYYDYYQPEAYLPITDTYIEKEAMINEEIDRFRHQATSALSTRKDVIIVASVSCIYNLGLPSSYMEKSIHLELEKPITRGDLIRQLAKIQFNRTNSIVKRGEFRVRGDVFEILAAGERNAFQITLSQQKVEKIFVINPLTRKILQDLKEIIIFPPKHFVSNQPAIESAIKEINKELKERIKFFKGKDLYLEAERLERRTRFDTEMLRSIGYCHGIENYSRHLTGKTSGEPPETLLSYLSLGDNKHNFLTIIDESHIAVPQIHGMFQGDKARKEVLIKYGWRLPSALDNRPLSFKEFEQRIGQTIFTSATPGDWELNKSFQIAEQINRPTGLVDPPIIIKPVFDKEKKISQVDDLLEEVKLICKKNQRAIINTLTKRMAEDLHAFFKRKGFKFRYIHSEIKTLERAEILTDFRKGKFNVLIGVNLLREGLDFPEVTLVAILDSDREGFLRNERSLMQSMGRAARNIEGRVILYADEITGSIKRAVKEVERRRKIQLAYNKKNRIVPKSIEKDIEQLIDLKEITKEESFWE